MSYKCDSDIIYQRTPSRFLLILCSLNLWMLIISMLRLSGHFKISSVQYLVFREWSFHSDQWRVKQVNAAGAPANLKPVVLILTLHVLYRLFDEALNFKVKVSCNLASTNRHRLIAYSLLKVRRNLVKGLKALESRAKARWSCTWYLVRIIHPRTLLYTVFLYCKVLIFIMRALSFHTQSIRMLSLEWRMLKVHAFLVQIFALKVIIILGAVR